MTPEQIEVVAALTTTFGVMIGLTLWRHKARKIEEKRREVAAKISRLHDRARTIHNSVGGNQRKP